MQQTRITILSDSSRQKLLKKKTLTQIEINENFRSKNNKLKE